MPDYEHCCKVGRIADKYDLTAGAEETDVNRGFSERWLGTGDRPKTGLRPLVDWFHRKVLKAVYIDCGRSTAQHRLESDYEALTSDDDGIREAAVDDLEMDGIDGETLRNDLVSTATLYRHLTDCLGLEKSSDETESNWEQQKVEYTEQLAQDYISDVLESWERKDGVPFATDANIAVNVYLECPVCLKQVDIERASRRGYVCKAHMTEEAGPPRKHTG